jgi:MerR family transcriptional regulator, thiopeptide resistance regulator
METRIKEYSVGHLARLAGVSVRTLHHYDEIGLLHPSAVGSNGYRLYGFAEALRLQEILLYREVGLSLADIDRILRSPVDALDRLIAHRNRLQDQVHQTTDAISTLDATIAYLKGENDMAIENLYRSVRPKKQAEYERWLIDTYGVDMAAMIETSKAALESGNVDLDVAMARLRQIETALVGLFESGLEPGAPDCHETLEAHRALMTQLWAKPCDPDGFAGLADIYMTHPDFVARYETLSPRFSSWLPAAMKEHAKRLRRVTEEH